MAITTEQISALYIAAFGRAPDGEGLTYWENEVATKGWDVITLADTMYQAAVQIGEAPTDVTELVTTVYQNVFGRAPTQADLDYWVNDILDPNTATTAGNLIALVYEAAHIDHPTDPSTIALDNKAKAGLDIATKLPSADVNGDGILELDVFKEAVAVVTDDPATITTAILKAEEIVETIQQTASNILVLSAGLNNGTNANDKFIGTRGDLAKTVIDGGAGVDTLSITVANADDDGSTLTSSNLEIVEIRDIDGTSVDLGSATGLEKVISMRSNGNLTLESVDTSVEVGMTKTASTLTVEFNSVTGTSDEATLLLEETETGAKFVADGIETLNIKTSGDAKSIIDLTDAANDFTKLVVTGTQTAEITANNEVTTVDASNAGAGIKLTASGVADMTVTGSGFDDTINMDTYLNNDDVIDGGAGTDTLALTGAGGAILTDALQISNVEKLKVTTGGDDTIDMSYTDISDLTIVGGADTHTISVSNLATTDTVTLENGDAAASDVIASATFALADATGSSDSITLNLKNNMNATTGAITALTVDGIETVNLAISHADTITNADNQLLTINALNADAATTLNLSGDTALTISSFIDATLKTIDASAMTGKLTINLDQAVDQTIKGGSADDSFDFKNTLTSNDTVDGGAGDDKLTFNAQAGTTAATVSNVETVVTKFTEASATVSGANWNGVTKVIVDSASDEAVSYSNLKGEVATIALSALNGTSGNDDTVTISYASGTESAHTLSIGDVATTPATAVLTGNVTVANNAGALTVESTGVTGNKISDFTANSTKDLTITTTKSLKLDAAGEGNGDLSATSAEKVTIQTAGEELVVDGAQDFSSATTLNFDASKGNITFTGDMTATKATTLNVTADRYGFLQTGNFVSDADVETVNLTASGANGSILYDGVLDVDHVRTINMTATDGGSVRVDDIEMLGVDDDGTTDITTAINVVANGEDSSGNASSVTIGAIDVTIATTLDALNITTDAKGTATITTGATNLTITKIDASNSLGTLTLDTSTLAAAADITTGAGTNTITTSEALEDHISLAYADGTDTIKIQKDNSGTSKADIVVNFQAGADGDVIKLDVSGLTGDGGITPTNAPVNGSGTDLSAATAVILQTDDDGTFTLDATTSIIVLTDTFADNTAVDTALSGHVTNTATGAIADNDNLLVVWTNGADTYLSRFMVNDLDTSDNGGLIADFDGGEDLLILSGVSVTDLTADNFAFI